MAGTNICSVAYMAHVSFEGLNEKLFGLILSGRDLPGRMESSAITREQVKEKFCEICPPPDLFSPEVQSMPAIYRNRRDWLNEKRANLQQLKKWSSTPQ